MEEGRDALAIAKSKKVSRILIIVSLVIAALGIALSIVTRITKNGVLAGICVAIAIIGGFTGIAVIALGVQNRNDYCPTCGARVRKTQTFVRRIEGQRSSTTSGYTIPYFNYYDCTSDCELCGWSREYQKKENAGKLFYTKDGKELDSVKDPRADFDTGYPDNSDLEELAPETRLKKVKSFMLTSVVCGVLLLVTAGFAMSAQGAVESGDGDTGDGGISGDGPEDGDGGSGIQLGVLAIPDGITEIKESEYSGSTEIKTLILSDSVRSIGRYAFSYCTELSAVLTGDGLESIGTEAFSGCESLDSIELCGAVKSIGARAFYNCSAIEYVVIGAAVETVDESAFDGCSGIERVYYLGTAGDWDGIVFYSGNDSLRSADRYYYSENEPTVSGNYWHYGENGIEVWGESDPDGDDATSGEDGGSGIAVNREVDEDAWTLAFSADRLSNVTSYIYSDGTRASMNKAAGGYIYSEGYDEAGNVEISAKYVASDSDIEEQLGLNLKYYYSEFTYDATEGCYVLDSYKVYFVNGVLTEIISVEDGVEYRMIYEDYGESVID